MKSQGRDYINKYSGLKDEELISILREDGDENQRCVQDDEEHPQIEFGEKLFHRGYFLSISAAGAGKTICVD